MGIRGENAPVLGTDLELMSDTVLPQSARFHATSGQRMLRIPHPLHVELPSLLPEHLGFFESARFCHQGARRKMMLSECFNPSCRRKLDYLRDGRVVRVTHADGDWIRVEHFWLCGSCYTTYDFEFHPDGSISLAPRAKHPSRHEMASPQSLIA